MIKSKQLAQALYQLSKEKVENLDAKFFDFLEKRNLKAQIPSVLYHLEKIIELDREKKGIQIETAHEIKHETISHIKKFLQADHFPEAVKIKKELIAGFRAKWNGMIYDASLQTGLKKLKESIIK
ncbi:MAG: F0F1 ATP synthase subunit delta [Patescibacteria group bacterium]